MRSQRNQSRAEGMEEGMTKGRADLVRQMLLSRGIAVSDGFYANLRDFTEWSDAAMVDAVLACESEADFLDRLRRR